MSEHAVLDARKRSAALPAVLNTAAPVRRCACGGIIGPTGECERCRQKRLGLQSPSTSGPAHGTAPSIVHEALRSPGAPLSASERAFFEPRFGHDFSHVRVHTDEQGARSARAMKASAYTVGREIVLARDHTSPGRSASAELLGHELAHVVQQGGHSHAEPAALSTTKPDHPAEQEARIATKAIAQGQALPHLHQYPLQVARNDVDAGAPPTVATSPVSTASDPVRDNQVACVIRLGGCASSRPAGIPTPQEIAAYNQSCRGESSYSGPDITPTNEECANPPRPPAIPSALLFARSLATRYPGWLSVLPNCPCTDREARANPSMWTGPNACGGHYHPGAASGYRSARAYQSVPGTSHGQQCCYDATGALITEGAAAGTPDSVAPIGVFGVINHYFDDVSTFETLGWQVYNQYWVPNNGNNCAANRKP